jgi:integrase
MFRAAADEMWIPRPVAFGTRWRKLMRPAIQKVDRSITREDCLKLLAAIGQCDNAKTSQLRLRATVLLALNGGYGPAEQAQLKTASVNLATGFIEQRREKTGVPHIVWLWPETVAALLEVWPEDREFVFQTRDGRSLAYVTATALHQPLSRQFHRLARLAGVRASFYQLRHTHRSVSGGAGDEAAADVLIGHSLPGMRAVYQSVGHDRIRSVSEFVRGWLFSVPGT